MKSTWSYKCARFAGGGIRKRWYLDTIRGSGMWTWKRFNLDSNFVGYDLISHLNYNSLNHSNVINLTHRGYGNCSWSWFLCCSACALSTFYSHTRSPLYLNRTRTEKYHFLPFCYWLTLQGLQRTAIYFMAYLASIAGASKHQQPQRFTRYTRKDEDGPVLKITRCENMC